MRRPVEEESLPTIETVTSAPDYNQGKQFMLANLRPSSVDEWPAFYELRGPRYIGAVDPVYGPWTYSTGFLVEK
jgi:hypothetical protein